MSKKWAVITLRSLFLPKVAIAVGKSDHDELSWTKDAKTKGTDTQQQANHKGPGSTGARQRHSGKEKAKRWKTG